MASLSETVMSGMAETLFRMSTMILWFSWVTPAHNTSTIP